MKIISLTSAAIRVSGTTIALEKDAQVDVPDAKAKHLIKVGIAKAVETKTPAGRQTKTTTPTENKADAENKADEAK